MKCQVGGRICILAEHQMVECGLAHRNLHCILVRKHEFAVFCESSVSSAKNTTTCLISNIMRQINSKTIAVTAYQVE